MGSLLLSTVKVTVVDITGLLCRDVSMGRVASIKLHLLHAPPVEILRFAVPVHVRHYCAQTAI